jgi:hypothetical protein
MTADSSKNKRSRIPRAAGKSMDKATPIVAKRHLCHQTGTSATPQRGQMLSGGSVPIGLGPSSDKQFGQADQCFFVAFKTARPLFNCYCRLLQNCSVTCTACLPAFM